MTFSKSGNMDRTKYKLMRNGTKHVREYKHLGFVFTSNGSMTNGINRLTRGKGVGCCPKYVRGLKQKNIHV